MDAGKLDELNRRAYGRGGDAEEAAAAQRELAALRAPAARPAPAAVAAPGAVAEPDVAPDAPRHRGSSRLILAAVLAAAAVIAVLIAITPAQSSLAVFDRAPTEQDLAGPTWLREGTRETEDAGQTYLAGSPRWLGESGPATAWAYLSPEGSVCLAVEDASNGAGVRCAPRDEFQRTGLEVTLGGGVGMTVTTVRWGPTGTAQFTASVAA